MTYTYDPPSGGVYTQPKDEVRFLLSDTEPSAPYSLSDEEIQYLLVQTNGNVWLAASKAARRMATKYSKSAGTQKRVGNFTLNKDAAAQAAAYNALADELEDGDGTEAPDLSNAMAETSFGPFWEKQFDNRGGTTNDQHYDVFAHPLEDEEGY